MSGSTVVVVEDDELTRESLVSAVSGDERLALAASYGTLREGLAHLRRDPPDVLLIDLGLPDGNGLDLIRSVRELSADTLALVVTVFGDESSVLAALEAGARGYLLKDGSEADIRHSIHVLLQGGAPISPTIARHLLRRFETSEDPPEPDRELPKLSSRETEVLGLVVKGFTFPEIADLLKLSPHTVTTHVRRIYRKLEVRSRGEAVFEAMNLGIVSLDD